jgi:N-acyl homoserine lactone hydrolase
MNDDVQLYGFIGGYIRQPKDLMFKDYGKGEIFSIPIPFFVVKHGNSLVAIDTGMSRNVAIDHVAQWGEMLASMLTPKMKVQDTFEEQVKAKLNVTPKDFDAVILTHGHLDHAGDIGAFRDTNVPIYLQKAEYEVIKQAIGTGVLGYIPDDLKYFNKLNFKPIEGLLDLFKDGTVVTFPMPGHTAGMQAVLVKAANRTFAIMSDACNTIEQLEKFLLPAVSADVSQSVQGLYISQLLGIMGAEVVPMHDEGYWKNKPLAPKTFE